MGSLVQDVRYGLRNLARSPGFVLMAMLTLLHGAAGQYYIAGVCSPIVTCQLTVVLPEPWVVRSLTGAESGVVAFRPVRKPSSSVRNGCDECASIPARRLRGGLPYYGGEAFWRTTRRQ